MLLYLFRSRVKIKSTYVQTTIFNDNCTKYFIFNFPYFEVPKLRYIRIFVFCFLAISVMPTYLHEKKLLGASGNSLDYFSVKGTTLIDFRADNDTNFESLEKNSIDLYSSLKSIYLQDRENKIKNSDQNKEDNWENLDN